MLTFFNTALSSSLIVFYPKVSVVLLNPRTMNNWAGNAKDIFFEPHVYTEAMTSVLISSLTDLEHQILLDKIWI